MAEQLFGDPSELGSLARTVSPYREMGAYEALWDQDGTTFRRLARRFAEAPDSLPSDLVPASEAEPYAAMVCQRFEQAGVGRFGVRVFGEAEYPVRLRDATYPVELLYFAGRWELAWEISVAVVGTRRASPEGLARTRKLVKSLVADGYTVASGLASGIDTAAHKAAIEAGGETLAVIGTPLSAVYPKENTSLQQLIADQHLLVSQVPVGRYEKRDYRWNRVFFPERNATMSALAVATVIVEAGPTSGALIQARQALQQGRKLFVLDSCFRRGLEWPERLLALGAVRVKEYGEIQGQLPPASDGGG